MFQPIERICEVSLDQVKNTEWGRNCEEAHSEEQN